MYRGDEWPVWRRWRNEPRVQEPSAGKLLKLNDFRKGFRGWGRGERLERERVWLTR